MELMPEGDEIFRPAAWWITEFADMIEPPLPPESKFMSVEDVCEILASEGDAWTHLDEAGVEMHTFKLDGDIYTREAGLLGVAPRKIAEVPSPPPTILPPIKRNSLGVVDWETKLLKDQWPNYHAIFKDYRFRRVIVDDDIILSDGILMKVGGKHYACYITARGTLKFQVDVPKGGKFVVRYKQAGIFAPVRPENRNAFERFSKRGMAAFVIFLDLRNRMGGGNGLPTGLSIRIKAHLYRTTQKMCKQWKIRHDNMVGEGRGWGPDLHDHIAFSPKSYAEVIFEAACIPGVFDVMTWEHIMVYCYDYVFFAY